MLPAKRVVQSSLKNKCLLMCRQTVKHTFLGRDLLINSWSDSCTGTSLALWPYVFTLNVCYGHLNTDFFFFGYSVKFVGFIQKNALSQFLSLSLQWPCIGSPLCMTWLSSRALVVVHPLRAGVHQLSLTEARLWVRTSPRSPAALARLPYAFTKTSGCSWLHADFSPKEK